MDQQPPMSGDQAARSTGTTRAGQREAGLGQDNSGHETCL
jgi:hypothetical protein